MIRSLYGFFNLLFLVSDLDASTTHQPNFYSDRPCHFCLPLPFSPTASADEEPATGLLNAVISGGGPSAELMDYHITSITIYFSICFDV